MPRRILVVDDEMDIAETFQAVFVEAGYQVTIATDGYDALEKVSAGAYDLITMDIKMPKLDGILATRQIMDLLRLRRVSTPVLIISGYVKDYEKDLRAVSVSYTMTKPVSTPDLLKAVRQALKEE